MNHRLFLAVLAFSLTALTITSFALILFSLRPPGSATRFCDNGIEVDQRPVTPLLPPVVVD